jgi:DNA-binding NarL/FixJ family response regulator
MAALPRGERLRILVASDQALIAEAVRAALDSRGHEVVIVRWPGEERPKVRRRPSVRPPASQVGLLLSDLDRWSRVRAATLVVERINVPWAVLTTAPRGPAWGGLLAAGARVVLPAGTSLDDISDLLRSVVERRIATPAEERLELEAAWRDMRERHDEVIERFARLTPREREVLQLMYAGSSVAQIAEMLDVAPATVRSQVKSVLRKLAVNNQLAAVAAFDDVLDVLRRRPAPHLPTPRTPGSPRPGAADPAGLDGSAEPGTPRAR